MKAIEELQNRLRNEMYTRMDDSDIVDILEVLQDAEEEIQKLRESIQVFVNLIKSEENAKRLHAELTKKVSRW